MSGCCNGVDFSLNHEDGMVKVNYKELSGVVNEEEYKAMVKDFVSKVEKFYDNADDKLVPDEYKLGYEKFWEEWYELKGLL